MKTQTKTIQIQEIYEAIKTLDNPAAYISSICGVDLNSRINVEISYEKWDRHSKPRDFTGVKLSFADRSNGYKSVWRMVKVNKDNEIDLAKLAKTAELMNQLYQESQESYTKQVEQRQQQANKLGKLLNDWRTLGYKDWDKYYDLGSDKRANLSYGVKSDGIEIKLENLSPEDAHKLVQWALQNLGNEA